MKRLTVTQFVVAELKQEDQNPRLLRLPPGSAEITVLYRPSSSFYSGASRQQLGPSAQHFVIDSAGLQSSVGTEDQNN